MADENWKELRPLPIIRGKNLKKLDRGKNYIIRVFNDPYHPTTQRDYIGVNFLGLDTWGNIKKTEDPYYETNNDYDDLMVKFEYIQPLLGDTKPFIQQQYFNSRYTRYFNVNTSQDGIVRPQVGEHNNHFNLLVVHQVAIPDDGSQILDLADARGGKRTKKFCQKKQTKCYETNKTYKEIAKGILKGGRRKTKKISART